VADVAVFVTRFSYFGQLTGFGGMPFGVFEVAIVVRTLVLVWCVVSWVRRPSVGISTMGLVPDAPAHPAGAPA